MLLGMGAVHRRYVELLWNGLSSLAPAFLALMLLVSPVFIQHDLPSMIVSPGGRVACILLDFSHQLQHHSYLIVRWVRQICFEHTYYSTAADSSQQCITTSLQQHFSSTPILVNPWPSNT